MISALSTKYFYDMYQDWNNSPDMLLDPVTTVSRIALLQYKPEGTKISIQNHKITYMETSFYQGTWRMFQGDQREDLKNLYKPVIACVKWWGDLEGVKDIVKEAVHVLNELRKTYSETSTIYHTITLYKTIMEHYIEGKSIDYLVDSMPDINDPPSEDIKLLWNKKEIEVISVLLKNLVYYKDNEELKKIHMNPIEMLLDGKEIMLSDILNKRVGSF
jgi:hypothetical protein